MLFQTELLINAFKEWAIAVSALAEGQTIMLLRKGGIREGSKQFQVKQQQVWLYPTYEHQKPDLLKPQYSKQVREVTSGWHPATVEIQSYGEITHVLRVDDWETLQKLEPYHVWNERMISDRFKWKPQQPLTILLLRVANLPTPVTIPYDESYGGCKSWIDLVQPISLQGLKPVLATDVYQQQVERILSIIDSK